jgi:hypothetical protein
MKITFKILPLILALVFLFAQCEKEPEFDPDAPVDIPDPNFLAALIEEGVDTNEDGEISNAEAEGVTILYVS